MGNCQKNPFGSESHMENQPLLSSPDFLDNNLHLNLHYFLKFGIPNFSEQKISLMVKQKVITYFELRTHFCLGGRLQ